MDEDSYIIDKKGNYVKIDKENLSKKEKEFLARKETLNKTNITKKGKKCCQR